MNARPKIKISMTKFDMLLEIISIAALVFNIAVIALAWSKLPIKIPSHFNTAGQIDGYGDKSTLFILVSIIFVLYIGLTILSKYPHIYNYTVEITKENAEAQYFLAVRLMRLVKTGIILLFSFIQVMIVRSAFTGKSGIASWFFPIIMIVIFGGVGFYIYKSRKAA